MELEAVGAKVPFWKVEGAATVREIGGYDVRGWPEASKVEDVVSSRSIRLARELRSNLPRLATLYLLLLLLSFFYRCSQ